MIVSSFLTFPAISWWMKVVKADRLVLDGLENFQKMSYRNRYRISGSVNSILLTVPLIKGRDQHSPMRNIEIHNEAAWQLQHWRTIVSVYKRTPYFEYYEQSLHQLFNREYAKLVDFNLASIEWVKGQLQLPFQISFADEYVNAYPDPVIDLRKVKLYAEEVPKYYQVFEDRIGYQQDLSILDILFSEGPGTAGILFQS